ncbi:MAG TPA: hypothetical protein VMU56_04970 [Beijerinckiaceae bacterium]|nr:hypothetical protein [Beijerinckiaceae bacterium]
MTASAAAASATKKTVAPAHDATLESRSAVIFIAFISALILSWPQIRLIWSTGTFVDTDDAMRMVQVRDWMAGQGWYDLVAHRMDPPFGVFMHWTRLVDAPLAILIKLFGVAFAPRTAEILARITFPLSLQIGLIASVTWVAERLEGRRALLPAAFLTVLSGMTYNQFQPGRVDHDDVQIVLLMLTLGAVLAAIEPARWRFAGLAGALAALSLAVGLENLPFLAVLLSALPLAWAVWGDRLKPALVALAAGLLPSLLAVYAATIAPSRWTLVVCDALSPFHLVGFGLGGLACLALAAATPHLRTIGARLVCAGAAGAFVVGVSALLFPACLGDPYAGVDPVVRALWLNHVSEAQPLLNVIAASPSSGPMLLLPALFGLALIIDGVVRSRGLARAQWAIVLAATLTGCALSLWEVRATDLLAPIALLGGVRAAILVWRAAERAHLRVTTGLALLAIFPFGTITYALISRPKDNPVEARFAKDGKLCRDPSAFVGLAALPPGLVLAPIDAGAHLLAYTHDSVLGAPFHRDNRGDRFVLDIFRDNPAVAQAKVAAAGVRYVVVCKGLDPQVLKGSLADVLQKGDPPAWLIPAAIPSKRLKVFELR